jgi:predicted nuclease with RNAse H fold
MPLSRTYIINRNFMFYYTGIEDAARRAAAAILCVFLRAADSQETQHAALHKINVAALDAPASQAQGR